MSIFKGLLATAFVLSGLNASAEEANTWGLVTGTYNVGASTLVSKDYGSLEIGLSLTCVERADEVPARLRDMALMLEKFIGNEAGLPVDSDKLEISMNSQPQYAVQYEENDNYRLKPFYIDTCNGNQKVNLAAGSIDLTKLTFTAYATLKVETRKDLSNLTTLRQKLVVFTEKYNKEDAHKQIQVGQESIVVSPEKREKVVGELNSQSRLLDSSKTLRLAVDQEISGGFAEMYISEVNSQVDGHPDYKNYPPELTEDGRSKVTVPYTFSIQYIPANLVSESTATYPAKNKGTLVQSFEGVAVVDTDYYVAQIQLSTGCQVTGEEALAVTVEPMAKFKALAEAALTAKDNPFERVEETIGTASRENKWIDWERETKPTQNGGTTTVVVSKLNTCDSRISTKVTTEDYTYGIRHRLTLVTNNYAAIKKLEEEANAFTQEQRLVVGAKRVEVNVSSITPNLKDDVHYQAAEILAYTSALKQFTSATGETANKLLDEVQASEAYYTVSMGYSSGGGQFESAPAPRAAAAMSDSADSTYKVVVAGDGNIPMSEIRVDNRYQVTYRPKKDLIRILLDARESLKAPEAEMHLQ